MRMKSLQKQIEELEAENVSDKHWTLKGEASANSRPTNALLEEVLSFDHVQKSVPVVTEEVIQNLEERIKKRIVDGIFDDVVRKTPLKEKEYLPSRTFELQHTKSNQSLMQVYENEYMTAKTGGYAGQEKDSKLRKEHEEIEAQWENICYKLDSLCNAHFTPKPVGPLLPVSDCFTLLIVYHTAACSCVYSAECCHHITRVCHTFDSFFRGPYNGVSQRDREYQETQTIEGQQSKVSRLVVWTKGSRNYERTEGNQTSQKDEGLKFEDAKVPLLL